MYIIYNLINKHQVDKSHKIFNLTMLKCFFVRKVIDKRENKNEKTKLIRFPVTGNTCLTNTSIRQTECKRRRSPPSTDRYPGFFLPFLEKSL